MTMRRGVLAVLALLVLWLQVRLWAGEGSYAQVHALNERVETQRGVNESKRLRNKVLQAEIQDLKSGREAIEEMARAELGLVRQGETFFLFVDRDRTE